ncbi:MAG: Flp pilus assembly complex ATPase component TadA [Lachnospiraceae bacterium]|nr:Flp pilus assembly complex ATPase component TadA [Lachnospiraceae bacterium]
MLELRNISFSAENEDGTTKSILKDISLSVDENRFIVVTGPNGSGKSTLAKLIMGIIKPTAGRILLDGEDITELDVTERARRGISFAFQQPVRFKGVDVLDLMRMAAGQQLTAADACKYLSSVGLCAKDYIKREVNTSLSGGEIKRIEIATVLARGTKLSIFDEPEAGIDLWSFKNLIEVFESMRSSIHGTIIVISHQERILDIADEIILLSNQGIAKKGTKDEILPELLGTSAAVNMCTGNTDR